MCKHRMIFSIPLLILFFLILPNQSFAQSTLDCSLCHKTEHDHWLLSRHADTQNDVAEELAGEWAGLPPDSVINGSKAENCLACHGAASVAANGGMTEVQTLAYFFSTTNGLFTNLTQALHPDEWPHNACVTCHDVQADHPASTPTLALFNSATAGYDAIPNSSVLCGQCHGTLRYPDTDHRRMDAWELSRHGHGGQDDVAGELAEEFAGSTPEDVIGDENCIACHASTSVLLNGGISEADALNMLFTTEGGKFTENTVSKNSSLWPEVSCTSCHNQHNPDEVSYFNSETREYETPSSSQELCGRCHGTLRFPETDHMSFDIERGSGGIGVSDSKMMPGITCVDCHMHTGDAEDTDAAMFGGHRWSTFISEGDGSESAACTSCHSSMDARAAHAVVAGWQAEFHVLDSTAVARVADAESFLAGSSDSAKIRMLGEAQFNLAFAEGDESAGVHNHDYTVSLLSDAIDKATYIVTGLHDRVRPVIAEFVVHQNYPNPFNPSTVIRFNLPEPARVTLDIFNVKGEKVATLLDEQETAGLHAVTFHAARLAGGIYFYRVSAGRYRQTMKMILLK